jgi:hypothetical protein
MTTPIPLTQALTAVQNGTLAQAIADVCAERDRLREAAISSTLGYCIHHNDRERIEARNYCPICLRAEHDRLRKENAILQEANRGLAEQGDRLRADCTAMQSALERVRPLSHGHDARCGCSACECDAALATDAGKGYVPADKARVIAEALLKSYEFISTAEKLYGREPAWIMAGGPSLIPQLEADLAIARELGLLESPQ